MNKSPAANLLAMSKKATGPFIFTLARIGIFNSIVVLRI